MLGMILPERLCICCFLCFENSPSTGLDNLSKLQGFTPVLPFQWNLPQPPYLKLYLSLSAFHTYVFVSVSFMLLSSSNTLYIYIVIFFSTQNNVKFCEGRGFCFCHTCIPKTSKMPSTLRIVNDRSWYTPEKVWTLRVVIVSLLNVFTVLLQKRMTMKLKLALYLKVSSKINLSWHGFIGWTEVYFNLTVWLFLRYFRCFEKF